MNKTNICICGCKDIKDGLCDECRQLLRVKRSKSIDVVEKFRLDYNEKHDTHKSYGQFVLMLDMIDRRRKSDDRRKKATVKKVR